MQKKNAPVETKKSWTFFNRKRLRKIDILVGTNETLQFRTRVLDKDTLGVEMTTSLWSKETFELAAMCLAANGEIFLNT